ncbi:hypothetical protein RV09_GL002086 [Enterococcus moraviensis]|nr:hypothetical protein RV09_GL002086 [Enterococcus moraviensis]
MFQALDVRINGGCRSNSFLFLGGKHFCPSFILYYSDFCFFLLKKNGPISRSKPMICKIVDDVRSPVSGRFFLGLLLYCFCCDGFETLELLEESLELENEFSWVLDSSVIVSELWVSLVLLRSVVLLVLGSVEEESVTALTVNSRGRLRFPALSINVIVNLSAALGA